MITGERVQQLAADVPFGAEGLAALARPVVEIAVSVAGPGGVMRHHAWLDEQWALFLLAVRGDEHRVIVVPSGHAPAGLARVLRLAPRRPAAAARRLDQDLLDRLVSGEPEALRDSGATGVWSVSARLVHADPDDEFTVRHVVLLRDETGQYLVRPGEGHWSAEPASTTDAWRALTSLLVD